MSSSYLLVNNLRYHYLSWNRGAGSRPLLLLHGLASNARIWELTAPYLAQAGLEVLAPDLRGHGLTDKPQDGYGFEAYAQDLAALVQEWGLQRPLLVGHSWGAMLALDFAARFAVGPLTPAGLALVDGGVSQLDAVPGASWENTRRRLAPPRLAGMPLEDFLARLASAQTHWQPDERALQIILANFEIDQDEKISPRLTYERHMQIVAAMWQFKTFERFRQVRCPVLLVPSHPPAPRTEAEETFLAMKQAGVAHIRSEHPQVQVHWMEDSIHDVPLQRPQELARLLVEFNAGRLPR